jgi:sec-independent protein translocase protein TatC
VFNWFSSDSGEGAPMVGESSVAEGLMSLTDHLDELRTRIIYAGIAVAIPTAVAFFFSEQLLKLLVLPSGGMQLNAFSLMDGFLIKWSISLTAGVVVAFPVWAYQIYAYIRPGLFEHERRAIVWPLIGAAALFVVGALFGYYMLWGMIRVLRELFPSQVTFLPAADDYISFVLFFMASCGLAFQLPTFIVMLARLRLVNATLLTKQRRIAYFALFAFAEIVTPVSDPIVAPLTVMLPLIILYEGSIVLVKRIDAGRARDDKQLPPGT